MDKTLHNKLTEKHNYQHTHTLAYPKADDRFSGLTQEMNILREAAKDLLQPRPQAVARLLQLAKSV